MPPRRQPAWVPRPATRFCRSVNQLPELSQREKTRLQTFIREVPRLYLDLTKNWGDQDPVKRDALLAAAKKQCPFLSRYEGCWPVEFIIRVRIGAARAAAKRSKKTACSTRVKCRAQRKKNDVIPAERKATIKKPEYIFDVDLDNDEMEVSETEQSEAVRSTSPLTSISDESELPRDATINKGSVDSLSDYDHPMGNSNQGDRSAQYPLSGEHPPSINVMMFVNQTVANTMLSGRGLGPGLNGTMAQNSRLLGTRSDSTGSTVVDLRLLYPPGDEGHTDETRASTNASLASSTAKIQDLQNSAVRRSTSSFHGTPNSNEKITAKGSTLEPAEAPRTPPFTPIRHCEQEAPLDGSLPIGTESTLKTSKIQQRSSIHNTWSPLLNEGGGEALPLNTTAGGFPLGRRSASRLKHAHYLSTSTAPRRGFMSSPFIPPKSSPDVDTVYSFLTKAFPEHPSVQIQALCSKLVAAGVRDRFALRTLSTFSEDQQIEFLKYDAELDMLQTRVCVDSLRRVAKGKDRVLADDATG